MVSNGCRDTTKVAGWKIRDEDRWHISYLKMEDFAGHVGISKNKS